MWTQLLSWFARKWYGPWYGTGLTAIEYQYYLDLVAKGEAGQDVAQRLFAPFLGFKNSWFNHVIVNAYFMLLCKNHPRQEFACINSNKFIPEDFNSFVKYLGEAERKDKRKQHLKQAKVIFWPLSEDHHWYLWIINKEGPNRYRIQCLDGLNKFENHKKFSIKIRRFLTALHGKKTLSITEERFPIRPQNNDRDCGVALCAMGEEIIEGVPVQADHVANINDNDMSFLDYTPYRLRVAKVLSEQPPEIFNLQQQHANMGYVP